VTPFKEFLPEIQAGNARPTLSNTIEAADCTILNAGGGDVAKLLSPWMATESLHGRTCGVFAEHPPPAHHVKPQPNSLNQTTN